MCNCIAEIEDKILDLAKNDKKYKKPVLRVEMEGKMITLGDVSIIKIATSFKIELEGQKKRPVMLVENLFCQFCGDKLED